MEEKLKVKDNISSFQKYHSRENIHSSNALLLLKKIYNYSHDKFYELISGIVDREENEWCPQFVSQHKEKDKSSVPDGLIGQKGFKILIEAKEKDNDFNQKQLLGHLKYFEDIDTKKDDVYLILLAVEYSANDEKLITELNNKHNNIIKRTTYVELCDSAKELFNEYKDNEIYELIEEFYEYCNNENLIKDDDYKIRIRACGNTLKENVKYKMYYDTAEHSHKGFKYLGLYNNKAVRYIGKIEKIIETKIIETGNIDNMSFECVENYKDNSKVVTKEEIEKIKEMINSSPYKDSLTNYAHKFFIMSELMELEFIKDSKGGLFTYRKNIDIREYDLQKQDSLKNIANTLDGKKWY